MSETAAALTPSSRPPSALRACLCVLLFAAGQGCGWAQGQPGRPEEGCLTRVDLELGLPQQVAQGMLMEAACNRDVPFMFWLGQGLNTLQQYDLANRLGYASGFSGFQLKLTQEVITLIVFGFFAVLYLKEPFHWKYLVSFVLLLGAVYFMFKK